MESLSDIRTLNIIHFNDSYNIEPMKEEPIGGIARFQTALKSFEKLEPIILFSGDLFSPSNLGTVYKGAQMIDPMNELKIKAACIGNHDFDYGLEEAEDLIRKTNFPWLLTNMTFPNGSQIAGTITHYIFEHHGIKVGLIGLAEIEWVQTLICLTVDDVKYEDFVSCANRYAKKLREEDGCEVVIALTHMRNPRDERLADKAEGIDLILGGHDHVRIIERRGDVYMIKCSGDFREFNLIEMKLLSSKVIKEVKKDPKSHPDIKADEILKERFVIDVKSVVIDSSWTPDPKVQELVDKDLKDFEENMGAIVGFTEIPLDCRFSRLRSEGTNASEFIADIARIATESDVCLLNSGTLRIDCIISEGPLRLREIFGMLPFLDTIIKLEVTGEVLLKAFENSVSQYPAYEGRFPMLSGASFTFDPKRPKYERILLETVKIGDSPLDLEKKYILGTKWFLAEGKDGYDVLTKCERLTGEESGLTLKQEVIDFFQMTQFPEFKKVLESSTKTMLHHADELHPHFQRTEIQGFKKKIEKCMKFSQLISQIVDKDGKDYISIAPKHSSRVSRLI